MSTRQWKQDNREKMWEYRRRWYHSHKEHAKTKVMQRKKALRAWLFEIKRTLKCSGDDCSESHLSCLEFHHEDPSLKEISVTQAVNQGWGKERILREIAKCRILCANCHRKLHWAQKHASLDSDDLD